MKLSLSTKLNGKRSRTLDNGRSSQNDSDEDHSTQVSSTGEFRFDQYLQAKWNQAMTEGIKLRNVGVVFKVGLARFLFDKRTRTKKSVGSASSGFRRIHEIPRHGVLTF